MDKNALRLLDANFNRLREGMRVCEDVLRFVYDRKRDAAFAKKIRHDVTSILKNTSRKHLLAARNSRDDVGRSFDKLEKSRSGYKDIFYANIQRAKESARVLEEVSKIFDIKKAPLFKKIRFRIYEFEKKSSI